jgi:hypothetical protein
LEIQSDSTPVEKAEGGRAFHFLAGSYGTVIQVAICSAFKGGERQVAILGKEPAQAAFKIQKWKPNIWH